MVAIADLGRVAASLLAQPVSDGFWVDRARAVAQRLGDLQQARPDAVLYLLFYEAARRLERYSSHHALVCAATVRACALDLGCGADQVRSLMGAALTMNLSITALQDELVYRERALSLEQRQAIDRHPAQGAEMLRSMGLDDALWLGLVAQHHVEPGPDDTGDASDPVRRLAALLRRVDVFTAKLSPRKSRRSLPPMQAVHHAYLGHHGRADPIGMALTRAVGIHPPGSVVTLVNGNTAIVLRRGPRPSRPVVASLVGADGRALARPLLHHPDSAETLVRAVTRLDEQRHPIDHALLLSL